MNTSELKKLIDGHSVDRIVLRRQAQDLTTALVWNVFCYDSRSAVCQHFGEQLVNNDGEPKTYTSIDRARFAIRALGFSADIVIVG